MASDTIDRSFMMVFLLEACDLDCPHCVREDEPMAPGYRLTFEQLRRCLKDCRSLGGVERVHFSGGEPTLWREGDRRLVDLLIEIAATGFLPSFISNGNFFDDLPLGRTFLRRYTESSEVPLRLHLSIDSFHGNFDRATGRAQCLDNVLQCREELPAGERDLVEAPIVNVAISKSADSRLPEEMVSHYESRGATFRFVPLKCIGKARSLQEDCPDFVPDDSGSLYPILIGEDYFLCRETGDPRRGLDWRRVAALGELTRSIGQHLEEP